MIATLSAIVIASTWSWVTYRVVTASSFWRRLISVRIWIRSCASRFDSGSSIRKAAGWRMMARASATRCRSPPESWRGFRSSSGVRPSSSATRPTSAVLCSFGTFRMRRGYAMLSATLNCG